MFDDVLRKLRQLERGVRVPIELELDDNGYLDRVCPSDECGTNFIARKWGQVLTWDTLPQKVSIGSGQNDGPATED